MTTDTEALRAQFEWSFAETGYDLTRCEICPNEYADGGTNDLWLGYQSGHAAAKAETAAAVERERERCASVADKHARIGVLRSLEATYKANAAKVIANAIRAGAKEPSDG